MSLLDLFRKKPVKDFKEEPLPSITLIIRKIEEIQARNPQFAQFITKPDITDHLGPVEILKNNIMLPDDDHYLNASCITNPGTYVVKKKDEETGKTMRVKVPVNEYHVKFHNFCMVPSIWPEPGRKKRLTIIEGIFSFYEPRQ